MPIPMWVARMNKRTVNPREVREGKRPVLSHTGRRSGRTYLTPLDAHPVDGGYIFIAMYGRSSDWVQNILASGTATLHVGGDTIELVSPRLIPIDQAMQFLATATKAPPRLLKVTETLQMDTIT